MGCEDIQEIGNHQEWFLRLNIFQVVQYKNSKIKIESINIDGLKFPIQNLSVTSNKQTRIFWSGPNTWQIMSKKEDIKKIIEKTCNNEDFAITDISHSRAAIHIEGTLAKEVLKKGCPINFNEFTQNNCVSSVFHGITIVIDCVSEEKQIFNLFALRSFGESLYHHISDASLEFGYNGI